MRRLILSFVISSSLIAGPSSVIVQPFKDIKYVPMPPIPEKPRELMLVIEGRPGTEKVLPALGKNNAGMINKLARGRIHMTPRVFPFKKGPRGDHKHKKLILVPGASSHVPIIGNGASAHHELGHSMGIGHANTCIWKTQTEIERYRKQHDFTDPMTITGGSVYNAAHMDHLQWFGPTEEAYAVDGGKYILKKMDDDRDYQSLKALYYEVPGSNPVRAMWISYVNVRGKGWNAPEGMPGTAVVLHEHAGGSTFLEGVLGVNNTKTNVRTGLIIKISEPTNTQVTIDIKVDPTFVYELEKKRCKA